VTTTSFAANAIPTALGYTPANKAGDTFSGAVSGITTLAAGNTTITGTANVSQGLTTNTLTTSTNTATFGTAVYHVANGFVGVGVSGPQSPLEVSGMIRTTGFVSNPSSGAGMELAWDGTQGIIQVYSNRASQTTAPVYFTGGQIKFPATQNASSDANTLDDYEEGTWTPFIDSSVAGSGRATSTYGASYLKVGRLVTVRCFTQLTTLGTGGSGWIKISGLPFAGAGSDSYSSLSCGYVQGLAANIVSITGTIDPGGSFFEMRGFGAAATGVSSLAWSTYAALNMAFIISCTYISV
jgi:hypothetical protein